ncbi:probable beta-1,3-galactosyltransferase 14 [Amaranthus tricolor]|uniref:probable beta-1,3-galactosyltransferase 14 n=1 Tax=Amaranthus tricolor TaxID=29722 RepID=UPI00258516CB|nr:probable beta-1,3-galactosyltransferase 14 [Amaranthus tricolor]
MPSSKAPRIFHSRSSSPLSLTRKPFVQIFCLLVGITGLIFGLFAISRPLYDPNCKSFEPRTVSVVWERPDDSNTAISDDSLLIGDVKKRHKVMGFVGIFTGFGSVGRRRALRQTWLPSDRDGLQRLEEATGLTFRFIIGKTSAEWKMSVLRKEVAQHDDFILLDIVEEYSKLPYKTLAFFKAAYALFDSEFYVKADDDIYLRPDRLSLLLAKERPDHPQTYIGCMKKGPVFTNPKLKWYEPMSSLLGSEYFLHAYGPIYSLSAKVVRSLVALRNDSFRMFSNEDVTIGAWMLAMNVHHENNLELCSKECTETSIAVWDIPKCSGLCNPETRMVELHNMDACSGSPTTSE